MIKRTLFIVAMIMAAVCSVQAAHISESTARQVACDFFTAKSTRFTAQASPAVTRLAYTAQNDRFYVFDRGNHGGFVIVAGDDRLPQVLGYGENGDFAALQLPPAVQYWMNELNRQIDYLQAHPDAAAHKPVPRSAAVTPLMTTQWDQGTPYNNYCPTYDTPNGGSSLAVTGCVATAVAQIMNYHKWPAVGRGSHSYVCNVNETTRKELSADFSQSVYQWDLMLDSYDSNSSAESCDAVARLMSDVGIAVDMGYGSSSGASEVVALQSLKRYFLYSDKGYLLNRDLYSAEEWDQFLFDELSAGRPILYCGFAFDGGHAFVFDGFNDDGYFHVNWGWGGSYDGYFLVSVLAPTAGMDFKYMQDAMMGIVPEPQAATVDDVLYVRSQLLPSVSSAQLGNKITLSLESFSAQGNMLDTAGYETRYGRRLYYALIPMAMGLFDESGTELKTVQFNHLQYLDANWYAGNSSLSMELPQDLGDGEYRIKLFYSLDNGEHYDNKVLDFSSKELYVKMLVHEGVAYLTDCFLSNSYGLESISASSGATVNQPFTVDAKLSYEAWGSQGGPLGNVYVSMLKDGQEVATSALCEVKLQNNTQQTYHIEITAPSEWGTYELVLKDESGNRMMKPNGWLGSDDISTSVFVLPVCDALIEDFESMTANSSTTQKNVPGNFTTWTFYKSGVRAPGEDLSNGANSVMMKKPSYVYSTEPVYHNFFMAQATFFNPTSSVSKYTLEYSVDGGTTWQKANTLNEVNVAEVPEKSKTLVTWMLNLTEAMPATFRITMMGGGTAATYVDDISFYYVDPMCDVNGDGEISIADVNAVIDVIFSSGDLQLLAADVNKDGEININDINIIIDRMLSE